MIETLVVSSRSRGNPGQRVGVLLHVVAAIGFAMFYTLAKLWLGYTQLPLAMILKPELDSDTSWR